MAHVSLQRHPVILIAPALSLQVHVSCCWVVFFKKFSLYCIFFYHYHLVPLYLPPPCNHHTVVHAHECFFHFAPSLHPLTSHFQYLSACSLSMNLSPFCLLVQFVHWIPHISKIIWHLSFSGSFHLA